MRFKLFLFVLVNIFATVSNGFILTDSDSNTGIGLIDTDDKMRHLRGTLNHAKTNDEERIAPVAAFAAGYLGAQQARMRAEQLAKQGGKVAAANHATQTNKIGVDKISGALTSASKKDRAGAIAFFATLLGLPLAAGAVILLLAKSHHTTSGEQ
ncbi:hypothetical protein F441_19497 [Phytophthora nicotianae CJ01A1]|uniref:RxLR effector protein n=2 Tax=Phytophthora nicotianae TaxID=4792 RepID=W2VYY6_PHYNI